MHYSSGTSPIFTSKGQEGMKVGGRTVIGIPKTPSPAPKRRKKLGIQGPPEKGTNKFHGSKSCGNVLAD
jgi:hypothetical protein